MRRYLTLALCISALSTTTLAQVGRGRGSDRASSRPQVQNRSTGQAANRSSDRSSNAGDRSSRSADASNARNNANVNNTNTSNRSVNNTNTNVNNRNTNVNNVNAASYNSNVNVNRNVNVNVEGNGCYNCGYHHDDDWNWGAFAVGATAAAVTTAAIASASQPSAPVVVAPPAAGTVVTSLPGGCSTIQSGGTSIYNCNNTYYRPYYQGTSLVYEVVPNP